MKALFVSFPASVCSASKHFYEVAVGPQPVRASLGGPVLNLFEWTEPWHGSGHSGLFIETSELDEVAARIDAGGCRTFGTVVHAWGGRSCTIEAPFGNRFDLIDADMHGDA